jgi:hypothetical protein
MRLFHAVACRMFGEGRAAMRDNIVMGLLILVWVIAVTALMVGGQWRWWW